MSGVAPSATPQPLERIVQQAVDAKLLPADTRLPTDGERPWPVALLTALGAWFAAVPLLIMVGMLLGDVIQRGAGPYGVGALLLAAAVVVLRAKNTALFVEQLAVPALLVGGGTLAIGVYRDFHGASAAWTMLTVVMVLAAAIPKGWLRVLLGALAAALLGAGLLPGSDLWRGRISLLMVLHALLAMWLASLWAQERFCKWASAIEPVAAGWLLSVLAGLLWLSGATFLVGGAAGSNEVGNTLGWITGLGSNAWQTRAIQAGASILILTGGAIGAMAWPGLRNFLPIAVTLVLAVLAWFMPLLGAVWLALMVCATSQRWSLAVACAFAAAWVVGSFYYQLQWPLAEKALVFVVTAVVLGALVWWHHHQSTMAEPAALAGNAAPDPSRDVATPVAPPLKWLLLGGTAVFVVVANLAIWQKEDLIAQGDVLYLALAPVDPRSLMEGDYMRLRFPTVDAPEVPLLQGLGASRPRMVVRRDARKVAVVQRLFVNGQPLSEGELLLELTPKNGGWVVVSDAWFFKEGDAVRWEKSRFGEFRVLPDGRALLVGMADADLHSIAP